MPKASRPPPTHGPRRTPLDDAALFDAITARGQLLAAWGRVWANGGASGGDHVTVRHFAVSAAARIARLRHDLRGGSYRPGPLRRVQIPKRSGRGVRGLSIPCVRDRIVQTSAAMALTPLFDEEFEPSSFGYRPGRGVKQAVEAVAKARRDGHEWVVDADIENYFDSIPHDQLMERWRQSVTDGPLTGLVWAWLTHAQPDGRGVAQGSPLSPLLANLYLDRLDEALHGRGLRLVRFADDFVILCRSKSGAEGAMDKAAAVLAEHGLQLNREKSRIADFSRGFRFLGHLFVRSMIMKASSGPVAETKVEKLLREIGRADAVARADALSEAAEETRKKALGYSPGFRVMHIYGADRRLHVRNKAFCVQQGQGGPLRQPVWRELIAVPHDQVDRIDLGPQATATDAALRHALATETPLAWTDGHGQTLGWLHRTLAPRARRHMAQARLFMDERRRLDLARLFVDARLRNQRAALRRLLAGRKEARPQAVIKALVALNRTIGRGKISRIRQARSIQELMGHEGAAGAAWWKAISALSHPDFRFTARDRKGRADAANICLNFLSWLLQRDISVAVARAGLHPGFGALHGVDDHHDACVYDLMEEFRAPLVGGLFVYAANRRLVRLEMFSRLGDGLHMNNAGAEALIRAYEQRAGGLLKSPRSKKRVTWRRLMVEQAFALAAHMEGLETYAPYIMDY